MSATYLNVAVMQPGSRCKAWNMHIVYSRFECGQKRFSGLCRICEQHIEFGKGDWKHLPLESDFPSMRDLSNPAEWWSSLSSQDKLDILLDVTDQNMNSKYCESGGLDRWFKDIGVEKRADVHQRFFKSKS